jgi:hypothetical protein
MSTTTPATNRITIANARPIHGAGQLAGAFDVVTPSGLEFHYKIFRSADGPWVKPPDAVRVDRDGHAMRHPNGRLMYDEMIGFVSKAVRNRFHDQVLAALAIDAPDLLAAASAEPPAPQPEPAVRASPQSGLPLSSRPPHPRGGGGARFPSRDIDDDMPFAPCWQ